jgi:transglutaminase-like putative cysteine protease
VFTDVQTRLISVPDLERGSIAFVEFESVESPETLTYTHAFQERGAVDLARLTIETPAGWELRYDWPGESGPAPVRADSTAVWELRDTGPVSDERVPLGPPSDREVPLLVVAFVPPAGAGPAGVAVVPDWRALAAWYETLTGERHAATPEISAVARGLFPGDDVEFTDRVVGTGRYVRDRVRYVPREIGIGAFQPRPAPQVLEEKLGDCKDKATLLRALLGAAGIESYPILVHATRERTVSDEIPAPGAFNHVVVGVPVPPEVELPRAFGPALVTGGDGTHLLVVDATDERASIGALPAYLAGKRGLLVAGDRSRILELPDGEPAAHRIERARATRVGEDGRVEIELRTARFGEPAEIARAAWRRSASARRQEVATSVARSWAGAELSRHDVEEETPEGLFTESVAWTASRSARPALTLFPDLLDDLPRVRLDDRDQPVVYPYALTLRTEHRIDGFDPAAVLPSAAAVQGAGWRVATHYERDGDALVARCKVELARRRFEPGEFGELERLWTAVRQAVSRTVTAEH